MNPQVAYKVFVREVLDSFADEDNLLSIRGKKVTKVNVVATVVGNDGENILIDDGTATARIWVFGQTDEKLFSAGNILKAIGRVRNFGTERYISPEIITASDHNELKLRRLELEKETMHEQQPAKFSEELIEEDFSAPIKIREIIRELDGKSDGKGADIFEVAKQSKLSDAEGIIRSLLEMGEIFEIRPGKLKVLE